MKQQHKKDQTSEEIVCAIGDLVMASKQLADQAVQSYGLEVDSLLQEQSRDTRRIERLLDGMLDFCFDSAMLPLYKKLCRYYFKIDPEATVFYINSYREMWDEEDDSE